MTAGSERVKVLLDTDIGTDIDDAVCLVYLLEHPRCDLLGITTVTGEAERRAMLASALCRWVGRDVPILPGASEPLLVPQRQKLAQQAEKLSGWDHATRFPRGEAVEFLRSTIRRHPHEVVLLSIGPLTNIGLLFGVDPEIPQLLKGLVMMCGRFTEAVPGNSAEAEWNAGGDPHATAIVYRSRTRLHRSVGLDVTTRVTMSREEFRGAFEDVRAFKPVLDMSEVWFRDWPGTTFHDPLAAATLFDDALCVFRRGTVRIDMTEGPSCGRTVWTPGEGDHEVAVDVDPAKFFAHYRSVVR
jgi:inosine-uridine nucleoside N-ribohydrolase